MPIGFDNMEVLVKFIWIVSVKLRVEEPDLRWLRSEWEVRTQRPYMDHSQELWFWEKTAQTCSSSVSTLDSSLPLSKLKWFSNLVFDVPQLWSPRSHGSEPARDSIFGGWGAWVTSALGVLPLLQAASDSAGLGRPIVENTAKLALRNKESLYFREVY